MLNRKEGDVLRFSEELKEIWQSDEQKLARLQSVEYWLANRKSSMPSNRVVTFDDLSDVRQRLESVRSIKDLPRLGGVSKTLINDGIDRFLWRIEFKMVELTEALIAQANAFNFLACAFVMRGLLEHAGATWHAYARLAPYLDRPMPWNRFRNFFEELKRLVSGTDFDWFEAFSGKGLRKVIEDRSWPKGGNVRMARPWQLIRELDKESFARNISEVEHEFEAAYSMLCDIVHPAASAGFLYPGPNKHSYAFRPTDSDVVRRISLLTILPAAPTLDSFTIAHEQVTNLKLKDFVVVTDSRAAGFNTG